LSTWLVTGGSGYIGQNVTSLLASDSFKVKSLDLNYPSNSINKDVVSIVGSYGDITILDQVLEDVSGVIHLGALKNPSESFSAIEKYRQNNLINTQVLIDFVKKSQISNFIFASSAAVYRNSERDLVNEDSPCEPSNPYGQFKMEIERYLEEVSSPSFKSCSLRLFNVVGVGKKGVLDTSSFGLVPQVVSKLRSGGIFTIYGDKHESRDGTAIRDYVHVSDVARSFLYTVKKLERGVKVSPSLNISTGQGSSVRDVIAEISKVAGKELRWEIAPARPGDASISIGDNSQARKDLGWINRFGLREIAESVWDG
jgi:UDP-glucose 4-epimerase